MKKGWIVIIALVVFLVIPLISGYNNLVALKTDCESKIAQVDNNLQRRSDLIPNLVATTKGYALHESKVMADIANARAQLAGAKTADSKISADAELSGAISRLLLIKENYPDLKANQQFQSLMDQLEGTENRLAVSRRDYNESVRTYNTSISVFPANIYAGMFGFKQLPYYEVSDKAKVNPTVSFE
ncbi:MAG: LemA family protein [Ignavibacteriales bacterium]